MAKIGSETNIENDFFRLKIGTSDKKNANVIYIDGGLFIKPIINKSSYKQEISSIKRFFDNEAKIISNILIDNKNYFNNKYIITHFEAADNQIKFNKNTFISFQYYFRQNKTIPYNQISKILADIFLERAEKLTKCIKDNGFYYNKTKF